MATLANADNTFTVFLQRRPRIMGFVMDDDREVHCISLQESKPSGYLARRVGSYKCHPISDWSNHI
jgi:hypothetical protein